MHNVTVNNKIKLFSDNFIHTGLCHNSKTNRRNIAWFKFFELANLTKPQTPVRGNRYVCMHTATLTDKPHVL